ncbi:Fanconi anemia [Pristimantis euphronides]
MTLIPNNGRVIAYNGQIVTFQTLQNKNSLDPAEKNILAFSRKVFNSETGQFLEMSSGEYSIPASKSTLELACVSCVADSRSGIKLPCVLLRTCKRKSNGSSRLIALLLHSSNELEPYLKFRVDSETMEDVHITDGPTILWRQHERLLYVSSLTSDVLTAPINISAVLWTGTIEEGTCVLGITSMRLAGTDLSASSLPNSTLQGKEFILYCIENQKVVPGSCLLPHAYSSVLQYLEVCKMQNVNNRYETSAIGVSSTQLIWFHNGVPKQVCQLPSENPSKLQVAYMRQADILCVLSFPSGNACGIWKDGWKTAATWQRVGNLLVDDFLGRGFDQLLVVFDDDLDNSFEQRAFTLTDCGDVTYPADGIDDDVTGLDDDDVTGLHYNNTLMLQTLEARLQANLLSLEELQRHVWVQDEVLESSCHALLDMSLGRETSIRSAEKEGLVLLWDDAEDCPSPATKISSPVDPKQLVETVWHRIVDDVLVVGVKMKTSALEALSDFAISLILDQKEALPSPVTKCQSNVLNLTISSSQDSSAQRQRLQDKDNVAGDCWWRASAPSYQSDVERTITAITELSPLLVLGSAACAVLLHARRKIQDDCFLTSESLIAPCGRVSWSLEDVLKGKHTINVFERCQESWSLEDIFALLSASQKCSLHISSPDCTLSSISEWMRAHLHGESLMPLPEVTVCMKDGSLHGTLFTWSSKTPCEGNLTVFYRNSSVLLQCLHSMKSILPPSCVVNVMRPGNRKSMTMTLAQSAEEELLALRNVASAVACELGKDFTLNCEAEKRGSSSSEQIQRYREDLRAEQVGQGTPLPASAEMYRCGVLTIAQIQMKSDAFVSKVANT